MRVLGITISEQKRIEIGLTAIYGVGRSRAKDVLGKARVELGKKPAEITVDEENAIRKELDAFKLEGDLKRGVSSHIKRMKDTMSYRGLRHIKRLPARGQRTKTNSRTIRGNVRKTMGSGRTKSEKK